MAICSHIFHLICTLSIASSRILVCALTRLTNGGGRERNCHTFAQVRGGEGGVHAVYPVLASALPVRVQESNDGSTTPEVYQGSPTSYSQWAQRSQVCPAQSARRVPRCSPHLLL